jgi:hypothetical protein
VGESIVLSGKINSMQRKNDMKLIPLQHQRQQRQRNQHSRVQKCRFTQIFVIVLWILLASNGIPGILGFYPTPHPNYTEWESVHQMRRRLNITYNYQPKHVPIEYCRFLSETKCRLEDEHFQNTKSQRHRKMATSIGNNIRVLVLLVRYSDHESRMVASKDYYNELFNGKGGTEINPVGSIREYLYINSVASYNGTCYLFCK